MITIIISTIVYLVFVYYSYRAIQIEFKDDKEELDIGLILSVIIPILNIIAYFIYTDTNKLAKWFFNMKDNEHRN